MSLRERVEAELARREQVVRDCADLVADEQWRHNEGIGGVWTRDTGANVIESREREVIRHIALHDPADGLARYAAARRVLARHQACGPECDTHYWSPTAARAACCLCSSREPCDEQREVAASLGVEVDGG